jgi:chromosome segregation ATPase
MFRAIARYFRALGYLLTGRIDAARSALSTDPNVVRATYDQIIHEKRKRIQQYKDAVAGMIAQDEKKKAELQRVSEEAAKLQKLKDGAAAMARKVVERLGGNIEQVKQDAEYVKCQAAFKDFGSTLAEKESRCTALEEDVKTLEQSIANHKTQLQTLLRELEKLSGEKDEAVADIITAKEEKELADMLAGVSEDRTNQELQDLRELRSKAKAAARVSREMAGVDAKRSEEEFLEYASKSAADTEFDALIGLTRKSTEAPQAAPAEKTRLPES